MYIYIYIFIYIISIFLIGPNPHFADSLRRR